MPSTTYLAGHPTAVVTDHVRHKVGEFLILTKPAWKNSEIGQLNNQYMIYFTKNKLDLVINITCRQRISNHQLTAGKHN